MLRCIQRMETDPYFNLAAEEHMLHVAQTDTFMVWRNDPAVIIGKHQNAAREINHEIVHLAGIPVIRRITGGGTVYHDHGNINFSFIRLNRKENPIDFRFFTEPIIIFLKSMGLEASFEGKSNITVDGLKVSGNSAHVHKGRVLHHGTLLFDSDLEMLGKVIDSREESYTDKSVRSIRRKVTNIASRIKAEMAVRDFMESFFSFIINYYPESYNDQLTSAEYASISKLKDEKYRDLSWNFGYSPDYEFTSAWETAEGQFHISITSREGRIEKLIFTGPEPYRELCNLTAETLKGVLHERKSVKQLLRKLTIDNKKERVVINQLIDQMF